MEASPKDPVRKNVGDQVSAGRGVVEYDGLMLSSGVCAVTASVNSPPDEDSGNGYDTSSAVPENKAEILGDDLSNAPSVHSEKTELSPGEDCPAASCTDAGDPDSDLSDVSSTSSSDMIDTSDTDDEGREEEADSRLNESVMIPRDIGTIEEVCECEHSHCREWQQESVRQARKDVEEEMQYSIDELKEKLAEAERQLKRKDCLLGEKVLASQKMQREIDELKDQLADSQSQSTCEKDESMKRNGNTSCDANPSCAESGHNVSVIPEAVPRSPVADSGCEKQDCRQVKLKLQFQQLALVANQSALKDLQAANDRLAQSLQGATEKIKELERSSQAPTVVAAQDMASTCPENKSTDRVPEEDALSPKHMPATLNSGTPCGNCILHQKLLERERSHVFNEVSNILHVCQESDGAESEVLIAKLHCELATKVQTSCLGLDTHNSGAQAEASGIHTNGTSLPKPGLLSTSIEQPTVLCGRCQQLTDELFEMKQKSLRDELSSKDTAIAEEEHRLSATDQRSSSALLTLRREREDLMLELKQLVSRHLPGASGAADSPDPRRHSLCGASEEEIQAGLDSVHAEVQALLEAVQTEFQFSKATGTSGDFPHSLSRHQERGNCRKDQLLDQLCNWERRLSRLRCFVRQFDASHS